jgi:hypothetical protein
MRDVATLWRKRSIIGLSRCGVARMKALDANIVSASHAPAMSFWMMCAHSMREIPTRTLQAPLTLDTSHSQIVLRMTGFEWNWSQLLRVLCLLRRSLISLPHAL